MIASKNSIEPQSGEPLPNSSRVHVRGQIHPDVRVPFRQVILSPTKSFNGQLEANAPVRVYDCSGPWGDPDFAGNVDQGLPPLRANWILARGDVESGASSYKPIPGRSDASIPPTLQRKPLRAKPGKAVTQLHYARQGIITPEMEFIAIRENLGREHEAARNTQHATRNLGGQSFGAAIPAFITMALIPFTFNIADGIAFGFISFVAIKTLSGKRGEVPPLLWAISALLALRYAFLK